MKKILLTFSIVIICFILSSFLSISLAATEEEITEETVEVVAGEEVKEEKEEENETEEIITEEEPTEEEIEKQEEVLEQEDTVKQEETTEQGEEVNNEKQVEGANIVEPEETSSAETKVGGSEGISISWGTDEDNLATIYPDLEDGLYTIKTAQNPKYVLDVFGAERTMGSTIGVWTNNYSMNQQFYVNRLPDSTYKIQARYSGYVFDIYNNSYSQGAQVIQWKGNNQNNQKFYIISNGDGTYSIKSASNNYYFDTETPGVAKPGLTIRTMEKNDLITQKFIFEKVEQLLLSGTNVIENGTYQIVFFEDNSKAVTIENASHNNCANVEIQNNYGGFNQKFNFISNNDGTYRIQAVHSGKMLDVFNNNVGTGTNIEQFNSNGGNNQKWIVKQNADGSFYIISKSNELSISAAISLNAGTSVYCHSKAIDEKYRKLVLIPVTLKESNYVLENGAYKILSATDENLCLDIEGASQANCANVELWTRNTGGNQKFKITYENGYYTIVPVHSNKSIDVSGASLLPNANVLQWEKNGQYNQQWILEETEDGYYKICSRISYMYLTTPEMVKAGSNVFVAADLGDVLNQKFRIIKAEVIGIDVSEWNGYIDWNAVSQSQDFAIMRVGYRGYRNPRLVLDSTFTQNIQGALSAGMQVGAYFFTTALNEAEAIEEANWTADRLAGYNVTYPVAVDVEWTNGNHDGRSDYLNRDERTTIVKAFCDQIRARGYKPMIYASRDWLYYYLDMSRLQGYDVWLAHYTSDGLNTPSNYTGTYTTWQYSSKGIVPGVNGYVDMNICYSAY